MKDTSIRTTKHKALQHFQEDMEEDKWMEWIDPYLLGTISGENRSRLEARMASDPEFAEMVKESQRAFRVIQHEKNRRLREKMKRWDQELSRPDSAWSPWMVLPALLMIVVFAGWCLALTHYAPEKVAMRCFEALPPENGDKNVYRDMKETWDKANSAFLAGDFGSAIKLYSVYADHAEPAGREKANWNLLLAQFAAGGSTPVWRGRLDTFIRDSGGPVRIRAEKLRSLLDSPFYRFFSNGIQPSVSGFQPRII